MVHPGIHCQEDTNASNAQKQNKIKFLLIIDIYKLISFGHDCSLSHSLPQIFVQLSFTGIHIPGKQISRLKW